MAKPAHSPRFPMRVASMLLVILAAPASAQLLLSPSSASTRLYFAQLADGGPAAQKWTTTIMFVNPSTSVAATVTVSFYNNLGQPLPLDFGQGPSATLSVNLPAGGGKTLTSTGASTSTDPVIGWGSAVANIPVLGTVLFREAQNDIPFLDVAATGTGSTYLYSSYANANLGIALANPGTQTIHLSLSAKDQNGFSAGGNTAVTLAPHGHTAFNLWQSFTNLPSGFAGSVTVTSGDSPPTPFVAWTLNARNDLLSPLPPGEMLFPAPSDRRPFDFTARLKAAFPPVVLAAAADPRNFKVVSAAQILQYLASMDILIDSETTIRTAFRQADSKILISQSMLEAVGGSDGALAFLISRELVRGVVALAGYPSTDFFLGVTDPEAANDAWALLGLIKAGFDPSGVADCYARLTLANLQNVPMDADTRAEFILPNGTSPRLQTAAGYAQGMCSNYPGLIQDCQAAHNFWHPHYPAQVP